MQVLRSWVITGNLMTPGFTTPRLLWIQRYEPEIFRRIDKVLLPKDHLHLRMAGVFVSDTFSTAGTTWLDVAKHNWSNLVLQTCYLSRDQMPALYEGNETTGTLLPEITKVWGITAMSVVTGGSDSAADAVGVGMVDANRAMLSLGASGVCFVVSEGFLSKPKNAVHSFRHALPQRWHLTSVILSAASYLDWAAELIGLSNVSALITTAQQANKSAKPIWLLPYLSGERTLCNDPQAKGGLFGLTHQHSPNELARAMLEGVGYALVDDMDVVHACGIKPQSVTLVGDGARSKYWHQILADVSGQQLDYHMGGDVGPALGAARLVQAATNPEKSLIESLPQLPLEQSHLPDAQRYIAYQPRRETFRCLCQQLLPSTT